MRILFVAPYPIGLAASQRFRFEQYFSYLDEKKVEYETASFLSKRVWDVLYAKGHFFKKVFFLFLGYFRRYALLFKVHRFDYIFIHREIVPFGPPILEFVLAKVFRKKIIYDFDDAIWIKNTSESNRFFSIFKWFSNVNYLCKIAYKVSCGNDYLCEFARKYNANTFYNPTTIDTNSHHNKKQMHTGKKFVIGWTGSHSTVKYLDELVPVLQRLENKFDFEFCVISDVAPVFRLKSLRFIKWNKQTEIEDLLNFSIGLMPLPNDKWANGKCGFKALQYMALGIPALVSPIGVNSKIVDQGVNGFFCNNAADWENSIELLYNNPQLLEQMSNSTQQKIREKFSLESNKVNFYNLFC
jgi:glycosyltransferase involved in cell wall biosynthesis